MCTWQHQAPMRRLDASKPLTLHGTALSESTTTMATPAGAQPSCLHSRSCAPATTAFTAVGSHGHACTAPYAAASLAHELNWGQNQASCAHAEGAEHRPSNCTVNPHPTHQEGPHRLTKLSKLQQRAAASATMHCLAAINQANDAPSAPAGSSSRHPPASCAARPPLPHPLHSSSSITATLARPQPPHQQHSCLRIQPACCWRVLCASARPPWPLAEAGAACASLWPHASGLRLQPAPA